MKKAVALLPLLLFAGMQIGCSRAENRLTVAVTIETLSLFVEAVGSPYVDTVSLVPGGVDPHEFSPDPGTVNKAVSADLIVVTGHIAWEGRLLDAAASRKGLPRNRIGLNLLKDLRGNLTLLYLPREYGGGINLHAFWLLPDNAVTISKAIAKKLSTVAPSLSPYFEAKAGEFCVKMEELKKLLNEISKGHGLAGKRAVIGFPAEQYVAFSLGIETPVILAGGGEAAGVRPKALEEAYRGLKSGEYSLIIISDITEKTSIFPFVEELSETTNSPVAVVKVASFEGMADYAALMAYNAGKIAGAASTRRGSGGSRGLELSLIISSFIFATIAAVEAVLLFKGRRR